MNTFRKTGLWPIDKRPRFSHVLFNNRDVTWFTPVVNHRRFLLLVFIGEEKPLYFWNNILHHWLRTIATSPMLYDKYEPGFIKQATFLTTRTSTGSKFDVFDQPRCLLQSWWRSCGQKRCWPKVANSSPKVRWTSLHLIAQFYCFHYNSGKQFAFVFVYASC